MMQKHRNLRIKLSQGEQTRGKIPDDKREKSRSGPQLQIAQANPAEARAIISPAQSLQKSLEASLKNGQAFASDTKNTSQISDASQASNAPQKNLWEICRPILLVLATCSSFLILFSKALEKL